MSATDIPQMLRQHGLNVTAQRVAVMRALAEHPHATADVVESVVRSVIGTVSRQAVYDALGTLTERGLLRRIQPANSSARYETRTGDNHHHVVCRRCRRMEDVDCAVGYRPCLEPSDAHGFEVDEAEVIYWGRCSECAAAADSTPAASPIAHTQAKETHHE